MRFTCWQTLLRRFFFHGYDAGLYDGPVKWTWRPILVRAALVILLSAATTVAVAWGLSRRDLSQVPLDWVIRARTPAEGNGSLGLIKFEIAGAALWTSTTFPTASEASTLSTPESWAPRDTWPLLFPWGNGSTPWPQAIEESTVLTFGWPLPSLACWWPPGGPSWRGMLSVPQLARPGNVPYVPPAGLPVHVLRRGFAVNTALAAALWSLVLFAPAPLRSLLRRRCGACPRCGYDLRSLGTGATCPECGTGTLTQGRPPATAISPPFLPNW
jgi:hypothetical protein